MSSVVVVGGGITGLAAAHALVAGNGDLEVTLLERDVRLGGKILTEHHDGVTFEAGADAFIARDPSILKLCGDLGLREDLIPPAVFGALIWADHQLKPLPANWAFGVPTNVGALLGSDLVPLRGRFRALWDLVAQGTVSGDDVAVGHLVRRRLGADVLERVVDPLLAGSRAGTADDISLAAALPPLDAVARRSSSVIRGLGRARREGTLPSGPPPFLGLPGGMITLVDRLASSLSPVEFRLGTAVQSIDRTRDGYVVQLEKGGSLPADAVVVTTPAFAAAEFFEGMSPEAARNLGHIQYASSAVAVLVYDNGAESVPASASGFLVPSREQRTLSACTWFTKKWPNSSPDDGRLVLRCFVGGGGRDSSLARDDDDLLDAIDAEVREALQLTSELQTWKLYRWERGLPHYRVGHPRLVEQIDAGMAEHPGLELAGAAYRGTGLPDCVRQGREAAAAIVNFITGSRG